MDSVKFFYGGEIRVCNSPVPSIETLDFILDILDRYIYLIEELGDI
jgi:hypothetical protein